MMNLAETTRGAVLEFLQKQGFPINLPLPLLEGADFRSSREIAERIVILYALIGLAHDADAEALKEWLIENNLYSQLLPPERDFFSQNNLSEQDAMDLSWEQEALYVLAWSGALVKELALPYSECHLEEVFHKIPPEIEVAEFLQSYVLVAEEKILFQADLHYCLHWVVRHPEVWRGLTAPKRLNEDVIMERRQAFEWMINSSTSWDDIVLDT